MVRKDSYGIWDGRVKPAKFKMDNKDLYCRGNSAQCYVAAWIGGEFGGEWIPVYVWLSSFTVPLKLAQHC